MLRKVYLDNVAAAPVISEVVEAMMPYISHNFGNPQSLHDWGDIPREALEQARVQVSALINGKPDEIIFTSCGTESNNVAIKGLAQAKIEQGKHIIISAIEHFSILNPVRSLQKQGFEFTSVPVDKYGLVDPDDIKKNIRTDTVLVSIQHANSEVGTIQNISEISKVVREKDKIVFHTDAIASAGNVAVDVAKFGVDALSLSGNQFGGPQGAAALWIRKGVRLLPLMDGGIQEGGRRPGTENVFSIVGLGKAAELAAKHITERQGIATSLRKLLIGKVINSVGHTIVTGHPEKRLPGYASFCFQFVEGEAILMLLNSKGIAAASGSACTSRALKASHVLLAMGLTHEFAQGSTLFTIGLNTNTEDIDYACENIPPIINRLREMSPLYSKYKREERG